MCSVRLQIKKGYIDTSGVFEEENWEEVDIISVRDDCDYKEYLVKDKDGRIFKTSNLFQKYD